MKFTPYITAHTNFKRTNESITSLIGMNYFKTIDLKPNATPEQIKHLITSHYSKHDGTLKMWGKILEYRLWKSDEDCTVYSVKGDVIGDKTFEIVSA